MATDVRDSGPWYHYFWPWFIVVLLGSTVLAGIATAIIAIRGADPLVVDDYYRVGKAINQTLAADREAEVREVVARLRTEGEVSVALEILGDAPSGLELELSHVTRAELDQRFVLDRSEDGRYVAKEEPLAGTFYATLRPAGKSPSWSLRQRIELPANRVFVLGPVR